MDRDKEIIKLWSEQKRDTPELNSYLNKYFTPSIEDIRVGYEYEEYLFAHQKWEKRKVNDTWFGRDGEGDFPNVFYLIEQNPSYIRVPYLTKEQIEAEGWEPQRSKPVTTYKKDIHYLNFSYGCKDIDIHLGEGTYLYQGECKDINTFRYISKLLGI